MNLPLFRAKSSQTLRFLLCALMACPSGPPLSTPDRDDIREATVVFTPIAAKVGPGLRVHRSDRKPGRTQPVWSVVADEPEATADPGDFRSAPPALPHRSLDFPGLVPSPLAQRPIGPARPPTCPSHTSPLRC